LIPVFCFTICSAATGHSSLWAALTLPPQAERDLMKRAMSLCFQTVTRGDSLMPAGYLPDLTPAHQELLEILRVCVMCGTRIKVSSVGSDIVGFRRDYKKPSPQIGVRFRSLCATMSSTVQSRVPLLRLGTQKAPCVSPLGAFVCLECSEAKVVQCPYLVSDTV
jgi:hypothetical protein